MNIQKITLNQQSHRVNCAKPKASNKMSLPSEIQLDTVSFEGGKSCNGGFVVGAGIALGLAICVVTAGTLSPTAML